MRKYIKTQIIIIIVLGIVNIMACNMLKVPINLWIREPLFMLINFFINTLLMIAFVIEEKNL